MDSGCPTTTSSAAPLVQAAWAARPGSDQRGATFFRGRPPGPRRTHPPNKWVVDLRAGPCVARVVEAAGTIRAVVLHISDAEQAGPELGQPRGLRGLRGRPCGLAGGADIERVPASTSRTAWGQAPGLPDMEVHRARCPADMDGTTHGSTTTACTTSLAVRSKGVDDPGLAVAIGESVGCTTTNSFSAMVRSTSFTSASNFRLLRAGFDGRPTSAGAIEKILGSRGKWRVQSPHGRLPITTSTASRTATAGRTGSAWARRYVERSKVMAS